MEYMRLEGFLGGAVSKLINKGIETKFGYKPDISLDQMILQTGEHVETKEDMVFLQMEVAMKKADFDKLIEEVTK